MYIYMFSFLVRNNLADKVKITFTHILAKLSREYKKNRKKKNSEPIALNLYDINS